MQTYTLTANDPKQRGLKDSGGLRSGDPHSRSLHSGSLLSRATDFGSGRPLAMGVYSGSPHSGMLLWESILSSTDFGSVHAHACSLWLPILIWPTTCYGNPLWESTLWEATLGVYPLIYIFWICSFTCVFFRKIYRGPLTVPVVQGIMIFRIASTPSSDAICVIGELQVCQVNVMHVRNYGLWISGLKFHMPRKPCAEVPNCQFMCQMRKSLSWHRICLASLAQRFQIRSERCAHS